MNNKQLFLPVVTVGISLGTAWAVRGHFGHEQGAAWAGAIGALSLILVSGRSDWYQKAFKATMAAAFGWGISGAMSYGMIVGYGRGTDFVNVYYGLLMLFVLGVLYGLIGGGLFGLALAESKDNKVKWPSLLAQMVTFGLLVYSILINQLELRMTPPRSEAWAACLGAGIAVAWYIARNKHNNAMKVALCSALGAGFGFAFGNFLQVIGIVSGIKFNFWNVMEYSIGFFGGLGMAYGTFTTTWTASEEKHGPNSNLIPILFVTLFIPYVVWDQSFTTDRMQYIIKEGGTASTILYFKLIAIFSILTVAAIVLFRNYADNGKALGSYTLIRQVFMLFAGLYIFLSFLMKGLYVHPLEEYLYIVNFIVILYLFSRTRAAFAPREIPGRTWAVVTVGVIVVIAVLALIAMNSHGVLPHTQVRFGGSAQ